MLKKISLAGLLAASVFATPASATSLVYGGPNPYHGHVVICEVVPQVCYAIPIGRFRRWF
jgi:hypothetical protein